MKRLLKMSALALAGLTMVQTANAASVSLEQAIKADHRVERAKRDVYRNPKETLEFFGLKDNMKVVEIWPGGGWYLDIIAPFVADKGTYYGAHFLADADAADFFKKSRKSFEQKIESDPVYKGVKATTFHPEKALDVAPAGSADMVLTFRNVHNWYMRQGDQGVENAFKAFFKALKSGGVLGVVEHRLAESLDQKTHKKSGYMKQSYVVEAAKKAGFKLAASSEINANWKDTAQHPRGVWTLPPRLALGEENKAKYQAIGESDRMTLKFVKP